MCLALLQTRDAGRSCFSVNPPPTLDTLGTYTPGGVSKIRFADPNDGWAYDPDIIAGPGASSAALLMTFDGGHHWAPVVFRQASS